MPRFHRSSSRRRRFVLSLILAAIFILNLQRRAYVPIPSILQRKEAAIPILSMHLVEVDSKAAAPSEASLNATLRPPSEGGSSLGGNAARTNIDPGLVQTLTAASWITPDTNKHNTTATAAVQYSLYIPPKSTMYRCSSGCVQFYDGKSQGECFGDMIPLRRKQQPKRRRQQNTDITFNSKQWMSYGRGSPDASSIGLQEKPITKIHASAAVVVAFRSTCQASGHNINHQFHDDFTNLLSTFSDINNLQTNFTLIYQVASASASTSSSLGLSWLEELLLLSAKTFGWTSVRPAKPLEIVCAAADGNQILLVNGLGRQDATFFPRVLSPLRLAAWNRLGIIVSPNATAAQSQGGRPNKPRIVFYTRLLDGTTRQWKDTESVVQLFNESLIENNTITIVHQLPTAFWDQVKLFSSMDILIAPNGGWAPNVMWMPPHACLIELHLHQEDSWIQRYGLQRLFQPNHFLTLVGLHYDDDPNATTATASTTNNTSITTIIRKRQTKVTSSRRGRGDNAIFGSQLIPDLQALAMKNRECLGAFLKTTTAMKDATSSV